MVRGSLVFLDTFLYGFESFTDPEVCEHKARESAENKGKKEQECLGHFNAGKEDLSGDFLSVLENDSSHQSEDENERAEANFFSSSHNDRNVYGDVSLDLEFTNSL